MHGGTSVFANLLPSFENCSEIGMSHDSAALFG